MEIQLGNRPLYTATALDMHHSITWQNRHTHSNNVNKHTRKRKNGTKSNKRKPSVIKWIAQQSLFSSCLILSDCDISVLVLLEQQRIWGDNNRFCKSKHNLGIDETFCRPLFLLFTWRGHGWYFALIVFTEHQAVPVNILSCSARLQDTIPFIFVRILTAFLLHQLSIYLCNHSQLAFSHLQCIGQLHLGWKQMRQCLDSFCCHSAVCTNPDFAESCGKREKGCLFLTELPHQQYHNLFSPFGICRAEIIFLQL